jgi:hypothetical protein
MIQVTDRLFESTDSSGKGALHTVAYGLGDASDASRDAEQVRNLTRLAALIVLAIDPG